MTAATTPAMTDIKPATDEDIAMQHSISVLSKAKNAEAPELLKALKKAVTSLKGNGYGVADLEAVVAKAEGRQS